MKLIEAYRAICNGGNDLGPSERLVLMVYCDHLGDNSYCWPSDKRVGEMAGIKPRQVKRVRASLIAKGLLRYKPRPGDTGLYLPVLPTKLLPGKDGRGDIMTGVSELQGCNDDTGDNMTDGGCQDVIPTLPQNDTGTPVKMTHYSLIEPPSEPLSEPPSSASPDGDACAADAAPLKKPRLSDQAAVRRFCEATGFPEWWNEWGDKRAKQPAEKAWVKLSQEDRELAIERTVDYLARREAAESSGTWIPHRPNASTYLNQRRWEDEFKVKGQSGGNGKTWSDADIRYNSDNIHSSMIPPEFREWLLRERPAEYWEANRIWYQIPEPEYLEWMKTNQPENYERCREEWRDGN